MPRFTSFSDPSDNMAGDKYRTDGDNSTGITILFEHIASGNKAEFKAFLETFDDEFTSKWTETEIFGRMDDIQGFKNTTRVINLSWTIPSHSEEEAISNFKEVSKLMSFSYPVYEPIKTKIPDPDITDNSLTNDLKSARSNLLQALSAEGDTQTTLINNAMARIEKQLFEPTNKAQNQDRVESEVAIISSPPILRLRFLNWANDSEGFGLYGRSSGFTFSPDLENGTMFIRDGILVPMFMKCKCSFTVIHTDKLGYNLDKKQRTLSFPYNANKLGE